tara:strand:- start:78 stop:476 length:399 start_codon:yes stop_codon:yes gene_type:complete
MVISKNIEFQNNDSSYLKSYETKLFRKNTIVYTQGEKIDFVYVILNGEVKSIFKKNKNQKENIILKKGSPLGLMDLILNREYSKTMLTQKTSVLALINKSYFSNLLKPFSCETILLKSLAMDIDNQKKNIWS